MELNANFTERVIVYSADLPWIESPMPGVVRRPLDRVGAEVARATSVVRYAPNSRFSAHTHTGGEEFFVLEGVFQDEHGDFPAGSYIRNPPQSGHTPGSTTGCTILVKLWQFDPEDRTHVRLQTQFMQPVNSADTPGVAITPLYSDQREQVSLQTWAPGAHVTLDADQGIEVFVLAGQFVESDELLSKHTWLRLPVGSHFHAHAGVDGAQVWVKQNHLAYVGAEIERLEAFSAP